MTQESHSRPSQPEPQLQPDAPQGAEPGKKLPIWRRQGFWRIVGTVLSLVLLVLLIRTLDWGEFIQVLGRLPPSYFWIALGLTLLSRVSVSLRWYSLLRSAGVKMSFWQCLRLTFMNFFSSNFLPTTVGGDLVRLAGAVYLHVDAGVGAASLVVDRLVGMAGMASLAPFGMAMVLRPASGTLAAPQWTLIPALARLPGVSWAYRKAEKFVRSMLRSSVFWLRHPKSLALALLCTYGHMFFTFLAIWLLLQGMHQPLSFWAIGALWSLNYFFTTLVPVSINGLGLQEFAISYLYSHFGGISIEAGLALAVLYRMLFLLASMPGALFLPEILRPFPAGSRDAAQAASLEAEAKQPLTEQKLP